MGKSRPKKSGTAKKREVRHRAAADITAPERASAPIEGVDGVMSGMVGGFRRAIGAERPAEKTWIDGALLWVVFALVLWMRSRFNTQADLWTIMVPTLVQGISMAFFFIPLVSISLSGIAPERIPAASGLSNFMRITAGAFGTSIVTTVWESRAALHHAQLAEAVHPGSPAAMAALGGLQAAGLTHDQALAQINRMVDQQAFMLAANDIFYLSAVLFLLLIPLVWLTRPQAAQEIGRAHV